MDSNYEIDFTKLAIGDLYALLSNPSEMQMIAFAHKAVVGGIMHLPLIEGRKVIDCVVEEFVEYCKGDGGRQILNEMLKDINI